MTKRNAGSGALRIALFLLSATLVFTACDGGRLDAADWPETPPNVTPTDTGGDTTSDSGTDTALPDVPSDVADDTTLPDVADGQDVAVDDGGSDDGGTVCVPTRVYWETEVWDKFMGTQCAGCHYSGGFAAGSSFVLDVTGDPGSLDANYSTTVTVAMLTSGAKRLLSEKPINGVPHGGGPQLTAGSAEHMALVEFVDRVLNPVACD